MRIEEDCVDAEQDPTLFMHAGERIAQSSEKKRIFALS